MSKYGVFSGLSLPIFELNTQIYPVNLHIPSECDKIKTRKNSIFGYFHAVPSKVNTSCQKEQKVKRDVRKKCLSKLTFLKDDNLMKKNSKIYLLRYEGLQLP